MVIHIPLLEQYGEIGSPHARRFRPAVLVEGFWPNKNIFFDQVKLNVLPYNSRKSMHFILNNT